MTFELLFNAVMLVFFGYCYYYIGATLPASGPNELGAEQWPQIILILLCICLVINIVKLVRGLKDVPAEKKLSVNAIKSFFTSKLFVGIILVFALAVALNYIGFVPACLLFLMAYSRLLGEKRLLHGFLISLLVTVILFLLFYTGLSILLPRGIGPFRTFALMLESFVTF